MADNLQKKPAKGILKNSSSFDRQETQAQTRRSKETKWDEMNIIATLHPADKDYGHMKIEEPKTPYSYDGGHDELDAEALSEKLASDTPAKILQEQDSEDEEEEEELSPEEKALKREFEMKRKAHYKEYYAVKLARKLLEQDEEEEDEENGDNEAQNEVTERPGCSRNQAGSSSRN